MTMSPSSFSSTPVAVAVAARRPSSSSRKLPASSALSAAAVKPANPSAGLQGLQGALQVSPQARAMHACTPGGGSWWCRGELAVIGCRRPGQACHNLLVSLAPHRAGRHAPRGAHHRGEVQRQHSLGRHVGLPKELLGVHALQHVLGEHGVVAFVQRVQQRVHPYLHAPTRGGGGC